MKKIVLSLLFIVIFICSLFSQEQEDKIDAQWVNIKIRARGYFKTRELLEFDKKILEKIEKNNIQSDAEAQLAELLYEIIVFNVLHNKEVPIKAFDILQKKFQNKKHFHNIASEYSYLHADKNPFVIAKIFIGLKELLDKNFEDNIRALKVIYSSIETPYIIKAKQGVPKYGTNTIVIYLIAYLREFIKLVQEKRIESDTDGMKIINSIYNNLALEDTASNFSNLDGAEELKKEYLLIKTTGH